MFPKNYLTTILKKSKISLDAKCSELGNFTRLCIGKVAMLCAISSYCSPAGGFLRFQKFNQNKYAKFTTTRKKTSSEKLVNQRQKKTIKQIIQQILEVVKEKFAILKFAENKVKKSCFFLNRQTLFI